MKKLALPVVAALLLLLIGSATLQMATAAPARQATATTRATVQATAATSGTARTTVTAATSGTARATATVAASGTARTTATAQATPSVGGTVTATETIAATTAVTTTEVITGSVLPGGLSVRPEDGDSARTLTVVGYGEAVAEPDTAVLTVGVETINDNVKDAVSENNERAAAIRAVLDRLEVRATDIQTTNFTVYLERPSQSGPISDTAALDQGLVYHVTQNLSVRITDASNNTDLMSEIIGQAVEAGANSISGPTLGLSGSRPLQQQARRAAVLDAYARAEDWATLTGVEITGIASVSESVTQYPLKGGTYASGMGGGPSISVGTMTYAEQVEVVFYIR